jgi:hypothetical protein
VGQVDELGNGGGVMVDLLLEELLPGTVLVRAHYAPTQVPSTLRPFVRMSSRASLLDLAGLDGCRSLKKPASVPAPNRPG